MGDNLNKIRVKVTYTAEFDFPGNVDEYTDYIDKGERKKELVEKVLQKSAFPVISYSDEESRKLGAMYKHMEEIFCNMDEDTFPDNPLDFITKYCDSYWDDEDRRHPGKCITVWEPFSKYPVETLVKYIQGRGL